MPCASSFLQSQYNLVSKIVGLLIFATVSYDAQPGKMHSSEATKRELLKGRLVDTSGSNPSNSSSQRRELLKGTLADAIGTNPSNSSSQRRELLKGRLVGANDSNPSNSSSLSLAKVLKDLR